MGSGQSTPESSPIKNISVDASGQLTVKTADSSYGPWLVKGPAGKDGQTGPTGKDGPVGPPGLNVKPWGEWTESDKTEFIQAIRSNEPFRDAIKNRLNEDNEFKQSITNFIKSDASFQSQLQGVLATSSTFQSNVASAVNNVGFQDIIKGNVFSALRSDSEFKSSLKGDKGDSGTPGAPGYIPDLNNLTTEVGKVLASNGLWCANGECVLPDNANITKPVLFVEGNGGIVSTGAYFGDINGPGANNINKADFGKTVNIRNGDGNWTHFNSLNKSTNTIRGETTFDNNVTFEKTFSMHPEGEVLIDGRFKVAKNGEVTFGDKMTVGSNGTTYIKNLEVNGRNILAELNDLKANTVRKGQNYRITTRRSGSEGLTLTNKDDGVRWHPESSNGDWEAFRFEDAGFRG